MRRAPRRKASNRGAKPRPIGELLRGIRQEAGVGIKTVAPQLGVNYTYLSKIENGVVTPSAPLLSRMAKYYAVNRDSLFAAASRLPPDVERILEEHHHEAVELLRRHLGGDRRER